MIRVHAPAKLNLGLRVCRRRPDGYHEIETIFVPLRLFDRLELAPAPAGRLTLWSDAPELPTDRRNLALRAAELVLAELGVECGAAIRLEKQIPIGAGLGGGSSDAAAAIFGVEALTGKTLGDRVRRRIALRLGADVPFFLDPRPSVGRGIGEQLEGLEGFPEMWWVLACMPFQVSTREVYQAAAARLTLPREASSIAALLGPSGLLSVPINDLETISAERHPEIRAVREALEQVGAMFTGMTGSGPTVYGRFERREEAEAAARRVELPAGVRAIVTSSPASDARDWGWGVAKW